MSMIINKIILPLNFKRMKKIKNNNNITIVMTYNLLVISYY